MIHRTRATPFNGTLNAAVIGVGSFGRHHARIYGELADQGVRLAGLVDVDLDRIQPLARHLGVAAVSSVDQVPGRIDLASIAVPTSAHRRVAEPLLRQGIHCLVEKPIAGSTRDASALVEAAREGRACLQVGMVERFNPVTAALDELGEPPVYVEVHRLSPPTPRVTDIGVVMDLMIHDLDILNHVMGPVPIDGVQAVGMGMMGTNEDMVNARLTYSDGCVANVTASRVSSQRMRRIRVFTAHGYMCLDYDQREARIVRARTPANGETRHESPADFDSVANVNPPVDDCNWDVMVAAMAAQAAGLDDQRVSGRRPAFEELLSTQRLPVDDGEPLRREIESLVNAVRAGSRPVVEGQAGLRALHLAERILASLATA